MSSPADESDEAPGDPRALERLRRFGGDALLDEMLAIYLSDAPARLGAARRGVAGADADAAALARHSLKSSSAQLGALRVERLSGEGERRARRGELASLPPILEEIGRELARYAAWVERVRPR